MNEEQGTSSLFAIKIMNLNLCVANGQGTFLTKAGQQLVANIKFH